MEYRIRSKRSDEWVEKYKGAMVNPEMVNLLIQGPTRVLKPNGKPLCVYLPGAATEVSDQTYPEFSKIRMDTRNRGYASGGGGERFRKTEKSRGTAPPVKSSVLGSFDKAGPAQYCRLTAYTANQVQAWASLLPYFQVIAQLFGEYVPDRYAAQVAEVQRTNPEWVIEGTPFTTITVNNTYPTGMHTDKGDLDAGFSTLGVMRKGDYDGGWLTFPQYGVSADMKHGDVILMDAHEWHGNTPLTCSHCGETLRKPGHACRAVVDPVPGQSGIEPERVSVVSYFRTGMVECGSLASETEARARIKELHAASRLGLDPGDPEMGA